MCGIAGFYSSNGIKQDSNLINKMTDSLLHRGPDGRGIFIDDYIALGHRRLSIIDVELGHQPMSDSDNYIFVVFNGEIFNYKDLKAQLIEKGLIFNTNSDTEVIINSYKYWGEQFIEKLNGMFAFALYNKRERTIYLYCDRIGVKPLYYTYLNQTLIFASEPKAIFLYDIKKKLNPKVLSNYLTTHNFNVSYETLYENINILEPANFIKLTGNSFEIKRYWDLPFSSEDKGEDFYIQNTAKYLKDATTKRLVSDVNLGAFLSGGVDSTILVSIINDEIKDKLKTFSVGFKDKNFNEFEYSSMVSKIFNIEHRDYTISDESYFNLNEFLISKKDFPLNVPNEVLIYFLSTKLKDYITVVLSGEGADELFGGYGIFLRSVHDYCKMFVLNKCPDFFPEDIKIFMNDSLIKLYKNIKFLPLEDFIYDIYSIFSFEEKSVLFNDNTLKNIDNDDHIKDNFKNIINKCEKESIYDKFLYFLEFFHLQGLLLRLDNATMSASVEGRVPFLDYQLIEFAFNIPFKYKLRWKDTQSQVNAYVLNSSEISEKHDYSKYILKKAYQNKIPDDILKRSKFSFPVPLNDWFNGKHKNYLLEKFRDKSSNFYEIFNYKNINSFINEPLYMVKMGLKYGCFSI